MRGIVCLGIIAVCSTVLAATAPLLPDKPNEVTFPPTEARFVRFVIHESAGGQPCIDELEVYGPDAPANLALAAAGAKATASSCLLGYAIHQVSHLNDGLYGNSHSWIAAGSAEEWAQIELPRAARVSKVLFSRDREGRFRDRMPRWFEVQVSADGRQWTKVAETGARPVGATVRPLPATGAVSEEALLAYAFSCEEQSWSKIGPEDPLARVLKQMEGMLERLAAKGLDVSAERRQWSEFSQRLQGWQAAKPAAATEWDVFFKARLAKRRLMMRDPDLAAIERILFVKRQPYLPSHNYSDLLDARGAAGGAVCILEIPRVEGRAEPAAARLVRLFDARDGVARDAVATFDLSRIYFAYSAAKGDYFRIMVMDADGGGARQVTDGPFHDFYPCPLPDGGLAFVSTRCRGRFLCWRPQAFVLFRMDSGGGNIRSLSDANVSEWAPSVMSDGRILWTRSEYLDKGADFGHTLWAIRPDGSHPELLFGNNTRYCYVNGREVPGTSEICATLMSHGGDLNGPVALIEAAKGRFAPDLVTSITPDSPPHFHMDWAERECFRDPVPVSRDYVLCSHAPQDKFGLYLIDRYGNREVLYMDPAIGSVCPTPFRATARPPVISSGEKRVADVADAAEEKSDLGQFFVSDVYRGLEPAVKRGAVRYIRVCQELRADLIRLPGGEYQKDHEPFQDWYATPVHLVSGPFGWPTYVAKADLGIVPVEEDGSANFLAPAGKVLYFQVLDEHFNELQRMRSVVQLQPGERRGCIGCHEDRSMAPPVKPAAALGRAPSRLQPPPWGAGPFSYEKVVQPVWDAKCVRCHDAGDKKKFNLSATLDRDKVPASYRTLIEQGWVHYFNCQYDQEHSKAPPLSFGTTKSRLWQVLEAGHYDVQLSPDEKHRIKCWTDLNCPLWPDYLLRASRPGAVVVAR
ncbi:MAG: discoidin domain-containing protein [Planctomycetota bacterium]|nr:discoidin domain-containing protein [Planctomycetota bacterium]